MRRPGGGIVADEIAPSLRWATATVTKNYRRGGGDGGGGCGVGGGRAPSPGPSDGGAGGGTSGGTSYDDFGEEPF